MVIILSSRAFRFNLGASPSGAVIGSRSAVFADPRAEQAAGGGGCSVMPF